MEMVEYTKKEAGESLLQDSQKTKEALKELGNWIKTLDSSIKHVVPRITQKKMSPINFQEVINECLDYAIGSMRLQSKWDSEFKISDEARNILKQLMMLHINFLDAKGVLYRD